MRISLCSTAMAAVALGAINLACQAKEKHTVFISYVLEPPQPLPEGLRTVAVIDAGVEATGGQQDEREQKWSNIAADMIEAMVQNSGSQFGAPVQVAKRRETRHILAEQDLALAGLVEGDAATQAGRLLAVQGLITSRITISVDLTHETRRTMDWSGLFGSVARGIGGPPSVPPPPVAAPPPQAADPRYQRPAPPQRHYRIHTDPRMPPDPRHQRRIRLYDPRYVQERAYVHPPSAPPAVVEPAPLQSFQTREVEAIRRHLVVQCSFSLIDAVTGRAIVQYAPPPYQKQDARSPDFLFGSMMSPGELDPVDHFIGELVEQATQEFVSLLLPTLMEYSYEIVGRGKEGEAGVVALRLQEEAEALRHFQERYAKEPRKHETVFALGVAYELNGQHERALEYYRQAAVLDSKDRYGYAAAARRLGQHIGRIRPAAPSVGQTPEK
jgi:hypothetical protein